jgi:hypothetical protein
MATKRLLGVEFLREGLKASDGERQDEPRRGSSEQDIARKRAVLTYSSDLLRTLRDMDESTGVTPRTLFHHVRERLSGKADFSDFELALNDAYNNRYVEIVGKDDFGDAKYRLTELARSITPA